MPTGRTSWSTAVIAETVGCDASSAGSPRIRSAALSAITIVAAQMFAEGMVGDQLFGE
jgi:hypothetical protein